MIRHCVMFQWADDATEESKNALREHIGELSTKIDGVKAFSTGDDVGVSEGTYDFCVTADFDSVEDYVVYREHPFHKEFIKTYVRPIIASRAAVQFEIE